MYLPPNISALKISLAVWMKCIIVYSRGLCCNKHDAQTEPQMTAPVGAVLTSVPHFGTCEVPAGHFLIPKGQASGTAASSLPFSSHLEEHISSLHTPKFGIHSSMKIPGGWHLAAKCLSADVKASRGKSHKQTKCFRFNCAKIFHVYDINSLQLPTGHRQMKQK